MSRESQFTPPVQPAAGDAVPAGEAGDRRDQFSGPTDQEIVRQLRIAGLIDDSTKVELQMAARNPTRRDYPSRGMFRIVQDGQTRACLMVGRDLADLHERTKNFCEACPDISCRPLLWHRADEWDYLVTEYFEGQPLEHLVSTGRLSPADAVDCATRVLTALERTTRPSTAAERQRELDQWLADIVASEILGSVDRIVAETIVFPYIRDQTARAVPRTRWTNGDLVARNLLVSEQGDIRLIDYEFATRTHFFSEDFWRWKTFSRLPDASRELPTAPGEHPTAVALFALRQMSLAHRIHGASVAVAEASHWIDGVTEALRTTHEGFSHSLFFRAPAGAAPGRTEQAQLFWSADGAYDEALSLKQDYASDTATSLTFLLRNVRGRLQLRLDPASRPGLLQISAIRIQNAASRQIHRVFDETFGWQDISLGGGVLRLADKRMLNLLCFDTDPHFGLAEIDAGADLTDIACQVWLDFSSNLSGLPNLLPPPERMQQQLEATRAALTEAEKTCGSQMGLIRSLTDELQQARQTHEADAHSLQNQENQIRNLTDELQQARQAHESLQREIAQMSRQNQVLLESVLAQNDFIQNVEDRAGLAEEEYRTLRSQRDSLQAAHARNLATLAWLMHRPLVLLDRPAVSQISSALAGETGASKPPAIV